MEAEGFDRMPVAADDPRRAPGVAPTGPTFREWLMAAAPLPSLRPWPLALRPPVPRAAQEAIIDLRAIVVRYEDKPEVMWFTNSRAEVQDVATRRLRQFGIILPRAAFSAVWRLYIDFLATFGADPPDLSDAAARAEVEWSETVLAQLRLAEAERDEHMPSRGVEWRLRRVYGEG